MLYGDITEEANYDPRGIEKDENSEYEEAIINFTKAIEIDSKYIDAYRSRASARIWINDYEGIVNDHTKIIELNSEDSDAYESRGRAKASLNDYIGAIEDFNNAIELNKERLIDIDKERTETMGKKEFNQWVQELNVSRSYVDTKLHSGHSTNMMDMINRERWIATFQRVNKITN